MGTNTRIIRTSNTTALFPLSTNSQSIRVRMEKADQAEQIKRIKLVKRNKCGSSGIGGTNADQADMAVQNMCLNGKSRSNNADQLFI